jgi:hypothetical protein
MAIEYVVRCVCDSDEVRTRMERWLLDAHLAHVVAAGAEHAALTAFDDAPLTVEARYRFTDRAALASYERDHAPRLRAEGRALFPAGVRFERRIGDLLGERT